MYLEVEVNWASSREVAGGLNEITCNFVFTEKPYLKKAEAYEKALSSIWKSHELVQELKNSLIGHYKVFLINLSIY